LPGARPNRAACVAVSPLARGAPAVDVQNTIVDKGGIKVMLELCKFSERKALPVLANACRALFHLAKNSTNGVAERGAAAALRST